MEMKKMKKRLKKEFVLFGILMFIFANLSFAFSATTFSGGTFSGDFGTGFSGGITSFSGVRVYGASVNPQFNNPGFLSSGGFTPVGVYWPKFDQKDCIERQDIIMQIAPGGCSPAVVRSDLLEEQNVPVFCKVMAIQVNPLIDISRIRSLRFTGKYPKGVSGISYFPAQAAVRSQESLVSSPVKDNLGYVVIVLSRNEFEKEMPDFVEGNITAVIDYDIENAFGIGNANFYVNELPEDEWLRNYEQYGFWNGKGYVRADSIEADGAVISIYRDSDTKQSTIILKKGMTSRDVYLGGFYCAAGMNIQLESIDAPVDAALLQINNQQTWVSKGDRILNSRCTVAELQAYGGGGRLRINCPVQNGKIDLSLNPGKVRLIVNGKESENIVGDKITTENGSVYLGYVGSWDSLAERNSARHAVLIKEDYSYNEFSFAEKEIYSAIEENLKLGSSKDFKERIKNIVLEQYRKKISGFGSRFDEKRVKVEVIGEGESAFNIALNEISVVKNRNWDLTKEDEKLTKEYYDSAIKHYSDLASFYPNERMIQSSDEDPYAAIGLYEAASLSKKIGMNEEAQRFYNQLLKDYPDSNIARRAVQEKELLTRYDSFQSKAIVNINNEQFFIDVLDFKKPSKKDLSAVLMVNGRQEIVGLNEIKYIDNKGSIQVTEIKDEYAIVKYISSLNRSSLRGFYSSNYDYGYESSKKLNLREQTVFDNNVISLADINLNKQAKLRIIPKAFGPRGESNFKFKIGIEKRGIQLSPKQTKDMVEKIDKNIKDWANINEKLGKVVKGLKATCFATSAILIGKNLISGFSGEALARKELMTAQDGWNNFCEKLVNDGAVSKHTEKSYTSVQSCLLGHGDLIKTDVDAYSKQVDETNKKLKEIQNIVGRERTDAFDIQGQTDAKEVENQFKKKFSEFCEGRKDEVKLPDKDSTFVSLVDVCRWDTLTHEQRREIMTFADAKNSGSEVMRSVVDGKLGKTVLEAKNFYEYEGARTLAEKEASTLNLGLRTLTPIGDNFVYGDVKRLTNSDISNAAYNKLSSGDNVVRVFIPVKENFGGAKPFEANSAVAGKEVIVKVKTDEANKDSFITDRNASVYLVTGEKVEGDALVSVREYMSQAKMDRIKISNAKAYQNKMVHPENLKVEYFERAPYKGLPAMVPFDVENGWYVKLEYVLSGFGKPYDESGRAVNFYICNVGGNGMIEFKRSADDICRYYNGNVDSIEFQGLTSGESMKLINAARVAISEAARQYGKKQVMINGRRFSSAISFGGEEGRCSDFMSPEDCYMMFNVCDPVICPASRCDLGGRFRVDNVIGSGIIGSLTLCLPNIREGIVVPICLSGVHAGIENYLSILNSTRQCLNESLETGRNIGICDEIKSIYVCQFFWKQASPFINVIVPRLIELVLGQGVRGGGEYLTVQSAWDNTQSAINYFRQEYAVNSINAFRLRTTDEIGDDICKSFMSVRYPSSSILDKLFEPDSPVQYSAWFSEDSLTSATIPPTSHYKVYYHIYSGKDIGSYYAIYLRDLAQSNYLYVSGTYIVDQGYITRGSQIDQARDFTAVSGYKQLCISVNGQEKCDFGKVSTAYSVNSLSDKYAAEQMKTDIRSEKECVAGTPSLYSIVQQQNLQTGVEEMINPQIYNKGIIRVCATENPGKKVLPSGQFDTTKTIYDRWKDVGYCSDVKLRCWLDTSSVKDVIQDKQILNQTLSEVNLVSLNASGYLTDEKSREVAAQAEKFINDLGMQVLLGKTKKEIDDKIVSVVNPLTQLMNLGANNVHRARGLYLLGKLYESISELLISTPTNTVRGVAPATLPVNPEKDSSISDSPSNIDFEKSSYTDGMLKQEVNIHAYFIKEKKDFVMKYSDGWQAGNSDFYNKIKNKGYMEGIYYLSGEMAVTDKVVINEKTVVKNSDNSRDFAENIFGELKIIESLDNESSVNVSTVNVSIDINLINVSENASSVNVSNNVSA